MKYIYFFLGVIVFSFSCTSCDPLEQDICERDYSFVIPVTLTPTIDTFHLGDTLQISMNFSKNMIDEKSSDSFDLSSFPFNAVIKLIKISQSPFTDSSGLVLYDAIIGDLDITYHSNTGSDRVQIYFDKKIDSLKFSCFMTIKRKGEFVLSYQSNDFFDEFNEFDFKNECRTKSVDIQYKLEVDTTDTNYELLKLSPDPNIVKITREKFDKSGGFAFVVID